MVTKNLLFLVFCAVVVRAGLLRQDISRHIVRKKPELETHASPKPCSGRTQNIAAQANGAN